MQIEFKCPDCGRDITINVNKVKKLEARIKELENLLSLYRSKPVNNKDGNVDFLKDMFGFK